MIILAIILVALPVALFVALFIHKGISNSGTIDIDCPQPEVFDYLSHPNNHLKLKYGKAALQIVSTASTNTIILAIVFKKPLKSCATCKFDLVLLSDRQTRINWIYEGNPQPYYLLRVAHLLLRLNKRVNKYIQASLRHAKYQLER